MPSVQKPLVDFGQAAGDYAKHRPGFPPAFFDHVQTLGVGLAGQQVLDLGTGTGTLARGFAERGCIVSALDPSAAMLEQAAAMARESGLDVRWVEASAEATGEPDARFDVVCAGQCWHWFDRGRAAREVRRVLAPGGRVCVAYFSYLPDPGTLAAETEALILKHNPSWPLAGHDGRCPEFVHDLTQAGFGDVSVFDFVLPTRFSHEAWRGRFRACNGVLTLPKDTAAAFDADLASLLAAKWPEPLIVEHRVWGFVAAKPSG